MCSVTSQGHPYAVFRRALERGNLVTAWSAALELEVVALPDALALCLLVRERDPGRFPRLALRWHARFCAETSGVGLEESRLVLDLLAAVGGVEAERAGAALGELLASYDEALAAPLRQWQTARRGASPEMPSPANPKVHGT